MAVRAIGSRGKRLGLPFGKEPMISTQEADGLLAEFRCPTRITSLPLVQAAGHTLAEDLVADRNGPPFDRVAMDGIGLCRARVLAGQNTFKTLGLQAAGSVQMTLEDEQACLEVMTGAPLPKGCDAVIPFEQIENLGDHYRLLDPEKLASSISPMMNVHREGEDFKKGDIVLPAPCQLRAPHIAVAASLGYHKVKVFDSPSIAIVTTGSELVDIDQTPLPHQIRKSNVHAGAACLELRGYQKVKLYHLPDDEKQTREQLDTWLKEHDMIILSGGVSKGKLDFVPQALEDIGVKKVFHRLAQKPGKPLWFGHKGERLVFGCPGNPAAMLVCMERYVLPMLDRSMGLQRPQLWVKTPEPCPSKPSLTFYKTAKLTTTPTGLGASICKDHGSGDFSAPARGDGFVEVPACPKGAQDLPEFLRFHPWS